MIAQHFFSALLINLVEISVAQIIKGAGDGQYAHGYFYR